MTESDSDSESFESKKLNRSGDTLRYDPGGVIDGDGAGSAVHALSNPHPYRLVSSCRSDMMSATSLSVLHVSS